MVIFIVTWLCLFICKIHYSGSNLIRMVCQKYISFSESKFLATIKINILPVYYFCITQNKSYVDAGMLLCLNLFQIYTFILRLDDTIFFSETPGIFHLIVVVCVWIQNVLIFKNLKKMNSWVPFQLLIHTNGDDFKTMYQSFYFSSHAFYWLWLAYYTFCLESSKCILISTNSINFIEWNSLSNQFLVLLWKCS